MKRLSRIILTLTLITLFSCNDDDNENYDISANDLIGVWELYSITSNGEEFNEYPECLDRLTFTANGLNYVEYFDFNDNNGCVIVPGQNLDDSFPYTVEGNNLSIENGITEPFIYEIIELNSTTLRLRDVYTVDGITYTDIESYSKLVE